jgi:uncharacterized membrane protein YtjA (UPF0391 family)
MLKWALIFFVISIIAGFFGFSGVSSATAGIAKILFFIALAIFLIFLVLAFVVGTMQICGACSGSGRSWAHGSRVNWCQSWCGG